MSLITAGLTFFASMVLLVLWAFTDKVAGIAVFIPLFIWLCFLFVDVVILGWMLKRQSKKRSSFFDNY